LIAATAGPLAAPAAAQTALPLRVDCGDLNGHATPEAGYAILSEAAAPAGVALAPAALDTVHVAALGTAGQVVVPADVFTVDPDELVRRHRLTSLQLAQGTTLTVSGLPANTPLRVHVEVGAASPWADLVGNTPIFGALTASRGVLVETLQSTGPDVWRPLARELLCTSGYQSTTHASVLGGVVSLWARVRSTAAGTLVLRFSSSVGDPVFLAGFEVHAYEALPVVYHAPPAGGGPLVATHGALSAFAAAVNAADYDAAEALALAEADAFRRGVALVHLLGWLDGSRDGRLHLIDPAREALLAALSGHPSVPWLLSQLEQFERAHQHLDAREYSSAMACPPAGGTGFLNTACAGQVQLVTGVSVANVNAHAALRRLSGLCAPVTAATARPEIDAYNAAALSDAGWEPSPLLYGALKQYGATLAMVNPFLTPSGTDGGAFVQQFKDVFLAGLSGAAFQAQHFPKDMELPLFAAFATAGQHPFQWSAATVTAALSPARIAASWWGPEVESLPADPAWAPWVSLQRDARRMIGAISDYWLTERLRRHELGGGFGDDVELLLQLFPLYASQQRPEDRVALDALEGIAHHGLVASGIVQDGYFAGALSDVEHTGEYTNNTFMALRGTYGYTARAIQTGFQIGRHILSADEPAAAWAAPTDAPFLRLHFKSSWFTADGPSTLPEHAGDIPLVGRATYPALSVAGHQPLDAGHPLLADLRAWAAAWRDDALDTTGGKPKGYFGPVDWPSNAFGDGGQWWKTNSASESESTTNPVLKLGEASFVTELLKLAYRTSDEADRWRYLLPMVRMLRSVALWEPLKPAGTPGDANWANTQYFTGTRFHAAVTSLRGTLAADPDLTTLDDPDLIGSLPYVDAGLLATMGAWAETTSLASYNLAQRYALLPVLPCLGVPTAKNQGAMQFPYETAVAYYRAVFPLLTRHVLHTDRVFMNRNNVLGSLLMGAGGGVLMEGHPLSPALRWIVRTPGSDLSVACNRLSYDGSAYAAFVLNAGATDVEVDLALDEGLLPGRYRVEHGPAVKTCDAFPTGTATTVVTVQKRGAGVPVSLTLPPGLRLVMIQREAAPDAPAAARDLALDPPRFRLVKPAGAGGATGGHGLGGHAVVPALRVTVRVLNAGRDPSLPTLIELYGRVLDADGLPAEPWDELLFHSAFVPTLAGASGYDLAEHHVVVDVPVTGAVPTLLAQGMRLAVRAKLVSDPFEHDLLNDEMVRSVALPDLGVGHALLP
jgi:hypothetical protein